MMTVEELLTRFPDEETCRQHLLKLRWPDKVHCPRCGLAIRVYKTAQPWRWTCKHCSRNGYRFGLMTGTIFEDTKIPLRKWFQVLFLMLGAKKGMSALQVQGAVFGKKVAKSGKLVNKGSYETTWYMCHRLRAAMKNETFRQLVGIVEVDEMWVGGKERFKHKGKRSKNPIAGKTPVIGAIARKGNVVAQVVDQLDHGTMHRFVRKTVSPKVSLMATDEHDGYQYALDVPHATVKHSEEEYVRGVVHTQNIESFWSLVKRGIVGNFHQVSKKYLPLYVNEFTYRHNHRQDPGSFDRVLESC